MRTMKLVSLFILSVTLSTTGLSAQSGSELSQEAEQTMLKATRFMVEKVSTNGGISGIILPIYPADGERWRRTKQ
jgi:hypothetical protein